MKPQQRRNLEILALPLDEQRGAFLALYRDVYAAYRVDWEKNTESFHDDYVFEGRGTIFFPGLPQRVEGREGYIEGHEQLNEVVQVELVEIDDVIPLGEGRVVVLSRIATRMSGVEIEQQMIELHEYEDGLLRRQTYWFHRDEGRQELGL